MASFRVFSTIKKGADLISQNAVCAFDLWRQGDTLDAAEKLTEIANDCAILERQAREAARELAESIQTLEAIDRTAPVQFVHVIARAPDPEFIGPVTAWLVLESDGEPPLEGETVEAYERRIGFRLLSLRPVPSDA